MVRSGVGRQSSVADGLAKIETANHRNTQTDRQTDGRTDADYSSLDVDVVVV